MNNLALGLIAVGAVCALIALCLFGVYWCVGRRRPNTDGGLWCMGVGQEVEPVCSDDNYFSQVQHYRTPKQ